MKPQHVLVAIFLANGLALMALSVPMIREQVPRNGWYGFRVPKTLASDEVWYPANRFMGRELLACGAVWTAGALALAVIAGRLPVDAVGWLGLALTSIPLAVAVYRGIRYLGGL
jgi:uncharacterized membrane protein